MAGISHIFVRSFIGESDHIAANPQPFGMLAENSWQHRKASLEFAHLYPGRRRVQADPIGSAGGRSPSLAPYGDRHF
jgi:hypothetical protein